MSTIKIQTGLRLEPDDLAKITYIAKRNKRSLNAQIEFAVQEIIETYEKEHGTISLEPE